MDDMLTPDEEAAFDDFMALANGDERVLLRARRSVVASEVATLQAVLTSAPEVVDRAKTAQAMNDRVREILEIDRRLSVLDAQIQPRD